MAKEDNLKPWPKGVSGNPKGRPPGSTVTAKLRALAEATTLGGKAIPGGKSAADLIAEVIVRESLKGDIRYVQLFLDRVEGKAAEARPDAPEGDAPAIREFLDAGLKTNLDAKPEPKPKSKAAPKRRPKGG